MSKKIKQWNGKHRRHLNKLWKAEIKVREISWQAFCIEMWNIWSSLGNCKAQEVSHV